MIKSHTAHNTTVSLTLLCYINNERNFVFPLILIFVTQRHTIDDATIGKAVLLDIMLHDKVVLVGVDTDVCITHEAKIHDVAEDAVNIRITGNAMDDVIGFDVIQPFTIVYL